MRVEPTQENIALAGRAIAEGRLVGLPTETVFGIACNAMDPEAVKAVFALKGRPAENPLIVHLASVFDVRSVVSAIPDEAEALAEKFWPGPLTMVLPKKPEVPDAVTAGLATVAVRIPNHELARAVIHASGTPVAAPSANKFMSLSPTVDADIDPEILAGLAYAFTSAQCQVGIESTVVDLSSKPFRLLRPGGLPRAAIEAVIGPLSAPVSGKGAKPSPGMYRRHYAPKARLKIVNRVGDGAAGLAIRGRAGGLTIRMPDTEAAYARDLYRLLHELDRHGVEVIEVEAPPADWEAVWDRLRRAAATPD